MSLLTKDKRDLPHAFLFTGPRGAGKTTAARLVAKLFNCTKPTKHGPCGKCQQCTAIAEGKNLDVLEIDAASNRGIDEMRALRDAIALAPSAGTHKVYIIDEVHMLTTEAFNALLKTLEEPPAHAVFILATTDPQKVPATIASRCIGVSFHRATAEELGNALKRIVSAEKIAIEDEALSLLSGMVDGSFRDAVKLLEQVSFHKGKITVDVVRSLGSLADTTVMHKFLEAVTEKKTDTALASIATLVSDGKDIKTFLTACLVQLETDLVAKRTGIAQDLIHRFVEAYGLMKISPIPQLPLELAVIEFCGSAGVSVPTKRESALPEEQKPAFPEKNADPRVREDDKQIPPVQSLGLLTQEKLAEHWLDFIAALKPYNHSVSAVLRSARPTNVARGIVTIEAFYPFHKDKLSEPRTRDILVDVLKKLFGEKVKIEIVLGKK